MKLTIKQLEKRLKLIDRFEQWFAKNPRKSIIAAECATIAEKYAAKEIKDLQNKYKSKLKEATQPKLTKVYNEPLIIELTAKVEVLQELMDKKKPLT